MYVCMYVCMDVWMDGCSMYACMYAHIHSISTAALLHVYFLHMRVANHISIHKQPLSRVETQRKHTHRWLSTWMCNGC